MNKLKRTVCIGTFNGMDFCRFNPRLFSYFLKGYQKSNFKSFVRMTVTLLLEGYHVYYMSTGDNIVGCAVITPGGGE